MKSSIILSLAAAMTLSALGAANAGDGAVKTLHGHHIPHRPTALAKATAFLPPAPAHVVAPQSDRSRDSDIFAPSPEDCARRLCVGY